MYVVSRHLIVPATFAGELALVGWAKSSIRRVLVAPSRSVFSDIAVYVITVTKIFRFISIVVSFGVVAISADWIHERLVQYTGLPLSVSEFPLWAQILSLFIVYTFFDYWGHRADHSRTFWPLHRFHHAAEDFCVLTTDRRHPADFTGAIVACSIIVLGGSVNAFLIMNVIVSVQRHVIHSHIDSDFGWVGRFLIQSPRHHRLHHVLDITDGVGNFGLLPIWDRLFGTWREAPQEDWAIGVSTPYRHGAWINVDMWRDYVDFWAGLKSSIAKRIPDARRAYR
jgi:sterol desaturase/sphingolipid hydroxylase (fatty acid hydroxylase superfamily)